MGGPTPTLARKDDRKIFPRLWAFTKKTLWHCYRAVCCWQCGKPPPETGARGDTPPPETGATGDTPPPETGATGDTPQPETGVKVFTKIRVHVVECAASTTDAIRKIKHAHEEPHIIDNFTANGDIQKLVAPFTKSAKISLPNAHEVLKPTADGIVSAWPGRHAGL